MEVLQPFGAESITIHSEDTLKSHPLLSKGDGNELRSELERALEIAIHHYLTHKDCPGKNKLQHDDPRHILHIAAKLYLSPNATPFCVEQAVQATLEQLDTDYIDLLIISIANNDNLPSIWQSVEQLYHSSKVKRIGVSEFSVKELQDLLQYARVKPEVNQVKLCCSQNEKGSEDLIKFASANGIILHSHPCHDNDKGLSLLSLSPGKIIDKKLNINQNAEMWKVNWALRYTVVYSERSVILTEGYLYNIVPRGI